MRLCIVFASLVPATSVLFGQTTRRPAVIDVHVHAYPLEAFPQRRPSFCVGGGFPPVDRRGLVPQPGVACQAVLPVATTNDELIRGTLAVLERRNIVAVVIGSVDQVKRWKAAAPNRVIPALLVFSVRQPDTIHPNELRELFANHEIQVLGEVLSQYQGIAPGDSVLEPLFAVAEESDIPVGIHVGIGPAGAAYGVAPKYRATLGNPLLLEEVLIRHPKLRLYVMHAGWPLADEMILLLEAHPQVYVDISVIDWILPRAEFYRYLRRLVEAGFGKRIMFGSDMFLAPGIIDYAIDAVESADFLTADQKDDILYNNAARFLRLDAGARD